MRGASVARRAITRCVRLSLALLAGMKGDSDEHELDEEAYNNWRKKCAAWLSRLPSCSCFAHAAGEAQSPSPQPPCVGHEHPY
jgi:hypothetical protein